LAVLHVAEADVVGAEDELDALGLAGDGGLQLIVELPEIAACRFDALPRVGRIDAHLPRRARHDLHQPERAGPRPRAGIEARFLKGLRGEEAPVPAGDRCIFAKPVVVGRKRAGLRGEVLTQRALLKAATVEEILAIERAE